MGKSRIEKIRELAMRGVGGEKSNAQAIYDRLTGKQNQYTYNANEQKSSFTFLTPHPKPGTGNIYLPYYKEVYIALENFDLWKEVYAIATAVTDKVLGKYNWVANDTAYITIACKSASAITAIQNEVNDHVWHFLMSKGVDVPNLLQSDNNN